MFVQSSDRVPINQAGMLCAVLVLCWVAVSLPTALVFLEINATLLIAGGCSLKDSGD